MFHPSEQKKKQSAVFLVWRQLPGNTERRVPSKGKCRQNGQIELSQLKRGEDFLFYKRVSLRAVCTACSAKEEFQRNLPTGIVFTFGVDSVNN